MRLKSSKRMLCYQVKDSSGCSKLLSAMIIFLCTVISVVKAENDWPRYEHPFASSCQCYKCPPGYYKLRDCVMSRDGQPKWPLCMPCPSSQFSQRWNTDGRCWDHDTCEKNHKEVHNGGNTGPTKCACVGATLENEDGFCVDGIDTETHHQKMKKLRTDYEAKLLAARKTTSTAPCPSCPAPVTSNGSAVICPPCGPQQSESSFTWVHGMIVGIVAGIVLEGLVLCMIMICYRTRRLDVTRKALKKRARKNDKLSPQSSDSPLLRWIKSDSETPSSQHRADPLVVHPMPPVETTDPEAPVQGSSPRNSRGDEMKLETDVPKTQVEEAAGHIVDLPPEKDKALPDGHQDLKAPPHGGQMAAEDQKAKKRLHILDKALLVIEGWISTIDDADKIMRNVLGLSATDCEKIKHKHNMNSTTTIRDGFSKWISKNGKKATVQKLVKSLKQFEYVALAEEIEEKCEIQEMNGDKKEEDPFEYVSQLCESMNVDSEIIEFVRSHLNLGNQTVDSISQDKKTFLRLALIIWREKNGKNNATKEKLIELFIDAGLENHAEMIKQGLQRKYPNIPHAVNRDGGVVEEQGASDVKANPFQERTEGTEVEENLPDCDSTGPSTSNQYGASARSSSLSPMQANGNLHNRSFHQSTLSSDSRDESYEPATGRQRTPTSTSIVPAHQTSEVATTKREPVSPSPGKGDLMSQCKAIMYADDSDEEKIIDHENEDCSGDGKQGNISLIKAPVEKRQISNGRLHRHNTKTLPQESVGKL